MSPAPAGHKLTRITSYNPEVAQNDSSPCNSSLGINICHYASRGVPIIAVSQDLVSKTRTDRPFVYGQRVQVSSPREACRFDGYILDVMNKRYRNSVDFFRMHRKENHGLCTEGTMHVIDAPNFFEEFPEQRPYAPHATHLALSR